MNNDKTSDTVETAVEETETRLVIEVPTELKAGRMDPWLPPCACQGCCKNGGCADGS